MEKIIWVIGDKREDMINAQRSINSSGAMKAVCILSIEALNNAFEQGRSMPSLIILDYEMSVREGFETWKLIDAIGTLSEIPLFFMSYSADETVQEECYEKGAISVIKKPFSASGISRVERMAWQFDMVKRSETNIERQAYEIAAAKEIRRLNEQLKLRNDFLKIVFGKYFSDDVMEKILNNPDGASVGGERMEMTVMMADLRGFTATAQSMPSDNMMDLLNSYFGRMTEIITKYKGTIIEFMGDGILAVFGAPIYQELHTESAIAAGISMQNAMERVNEYCRQRGYEPLNMGIGIHRGPAFIGNIGSEKVMRYNVIGSVVNECSRIESYSVGGQVLVSASTLEKLSCEYTVGEQLEIKAKGVKEPISVLQVLGLGGDYNCAIVPNEEFVLYNVSETIVVQMYVVADKFISDRPMKSIVKAISAKNIMVECDCEHKLEKYTDVKLVARNEDGEVLFEDVYAKIIGVIGQVIKLHFTHTNGAFGQLIERLNRERAVLNMIPVREDFVVVSCEENRIFEDYQYDSYKYAILYAVGIGKITVRVLSNHKFVRAIELLGYIMPESTLVKGDYRDANGVIPKGLFNAALTEAELSCEADYFEKAIQSYIHDIDVVDAAVYADTHKDYIEGLEKYVKKRVQWAFVKSTDIVEEGGLIEIRSLENESGKTLAASDELYIMIGCKGEIYEITRSKFLNTYEATDEPLDVFLQLFEFLPEVKLLDSGEYVSIDDKAKMCYSSSKSAIYATVLTRRTKVFQNDGSGDYFLGEAGDYMAVRCDDLYDVYIIQKEIFNRTYEKNM